MSSSPSKRPRLTGSFSPASPPYHLAKTTAEQTASTVQPNTPTSPPYMSTLPNANGDTPTVTNSQRPDASPTSIATMSQFSQAPASTNTFPTPASSVTGTFTSTQNRDADGDISMGDDLPANAHKNVARDRQTGLGRAGLSAVDAAAAAAHRRTDHDRQGEKPSAAAQKAMISYPYLCQKPIVPSQPWHVSANTLREYGLDALATSVLRHDPITGQKINKLRKTYKAVLQDLKLPGRTEPVVQKDQFTEMYRMPDDWWQSESVTDFDLANGFDALLPNLDRALKMDTVKMPPEVEKDARKIIGAEDSKKKAKLGLDGVVKKPGHSVAPSPGMGGAVVSGNGPSSLHSSGVPSPGMRPSRPGTKRRYNDSSFKGYGEGYADDDLAESTAGEDDNRGGSKKKRRKENFTTAGGLLGPPTGYNNVGMGMVGVRR